MSIIATDEDEPEEGQGRAPSIRSPAHQARPLRL